MYVTTSIINGRNVFAVIVYLSTGQVVKNKVHVQLLQSFVLMRLVVKWTVRVLSWPRVLLYLIERQDSWMMNLQNYLNLQIIKRWQLFILKLITFCIHPLDSSKFKSAVFFVIYDNFCCISMVLVHCKLYLRSRLKGDSQPKG